MKKREQRDKERYFKHLSIRKKRKKTENTPYNLALDFNFSYSIKALAISSAASVK